MGLQGTTERVTYNVLNRQVETFDTSPIDIELKSVHGHSSMKITAYRQTGNW